MTFDVSKDLISKMLITDPMNSWVDGLHEAHQHTGNSAASMIHAGLTEVP